MLDCCKKNKWFYFGLTIPSMLLYVLALAGPLLLGTLPASFYNWNLIKGNKDFVGLGNYTKLLGDETFIHSVVFTLILAVISILMSNLIGFVIAYFLDSNVRCKGVIRSLFFIPNIISGVMVSFVWSFIFTGAIPNLAKILHVDALANISWFGNAGTAAFTVILVTTWQSTGFLMMLYITGLQTIQKDVLEAAVLDGCTGIKKIIYIQLPLLMPTITINLLIGGHLLEVDKAAREREEVILKQLEEKEPLPDKEKDQMAWVRAANQHRAIAEEIILKELIYV